MVLLIIFPFIAIYFMTLNVVISYIVFSLLLCMLSGGYWLGYGLYKYFVWIWGAQINNQISNQENGFKTNKLDFLRNLKFKEGQSVLFGFFYTLLSAISFL